MVSSAVQEKLDAGLRRVPDQTHFECRNRMGDLFSGILSFFVESLNWQDQARCRSLSAFMPNT